MAQKENSNDHAPGFVEQLDLARSLAEEFAISFHEDWLVAVLDSHAIGVVDGDFFFFDEAAIVEGRREAEHFELGHGARDSNAHRLAKWIGRRSDQEAAAIPAAHTSIDGVKMIGDLCSVSEFYRSFGGLVACKTTKHEHHIHCFAFDEAALLEGLLDDVGIVGEACYIDEVADVFFACFDAGDLTNVVKYGFVFDDGFDAFPRIILYAMRTQPVVACTDRDEALCDLSARSSFLHHDAVGDFVIGAVAAYGDHITSTGFDRRFGQANTVTELLSKECFDFYATRFELSFDLRPYFTSFATSSRRIDDCVPNRSRIRHAAKLHDLSKL